MTYRKPISYLFLLVPGVLFLLLFIYMPLVRSLIDSLHDHRFAADGSPFVGWGNYARLFADANFLAAIKNNVIYLIFTVVPGLFLALLLALALRKNCLINRWLRAVFFFPTIIPLVAAASLVSFKGISEEQQKVAWKFMEYLTSPATAGRWSRFTGYFAPRKQAYDLPEMKEYLAKDANASVALSQLKHAQPWYSTYETVAVRKAMENQMAALLTDANLTPKQAAETAQKEADALLAPYVTKTALALP